MTAPLDAALDAVPTEVCTRCGATVPAGNFCGCCGAEIGRVTDDRLVALRPRVYAVAPRERVLLPLVTSTLFPQLPQIHRNPFRIGMVIMVLGVVLFSELRVLGALIPLVALGFPSLFILYLWQSNVFRDIPKRGFAIALGLGSALGISWVVLTSGMVARAYGIPLTAGFVLEKQVGFALLHGGAAILLLVPAVVVRLLRPPARESLDGFVIGALGALSFAAAGTATRFAPQFVFGLLDSVRPLRLLAEAEFYGIFRPLTAAALAGLLGIVLWFRPSQRAGEHPGKVRAALLLSTVFVFVIYIGSWAVDSARLPKWPQLGLQFLLTAGALLITRVSVQLALLHEQPDPFSGHPQLCVHCHRVVPDMAFCPACGAAARASSRSSRRRRRESPLRRADPSTAPDG